MLLLVVFLGRITTARADVDEAARDAARAASLARTTVAASTDGEAAARAAIADGGPSCRTLSVQVDTAGFGPGGTVSASVACQVDLSDLGPLELPGTRTISSTFVEPVDQLSGCDVTPRDQGTVTVFVTVFMAALMVVAGLVIDGGNTLAARREAADIAESAARAGAEQIDQGSIRAGGPITVDPVAAQAAAEHYLAVTGVTGVGGRVRRNGHRDRQRADPNA